MDIVDRALAEGYGRQWLISDCMICKSFSSCQIRTRQVANPTMMDV